MIALREGSDLALRSIGPKENWRQVHPMCRFRCCYSCMHARKTTDRPRKSTSMRTICSVRYPGRGPPSLAALALVILGIVPSTDARAQPLAQIPDPALSDVASSPEIISADAFDQYSPQTALDAVELIPGFNIREVETRRGIGTNETNVLINGRRVTGKLDDVVATLRRIPFEDVIRIEIGDAADFNIVGVAGDAVNIVTGTNDLSGQFSWNPVFRIRRTDPVLLDGSVSLSGSSGPFEYTFGFENTSLRDGAAGPELVFLADGSLVDRRDEVFELDLDRPRISGNLRYEGSNSHEGNVSFAAARSYFDFEEVSFRLTGDPMEQTRTLAQRQRERSWEVSADYQFPFIGGTLKLIGVRREESLPVTTSVTTEIAATQSASATVFTEDRQERQTTFRAEQRFGGKSGNWLIAGEYGFNRFRNDTLLEFVGPDGDRTEIPLSGSDGTIEEERVEATLSYSGQVARDVALQATAGGEVSWIEQTGNTLSNRRFFRPKGVVTVNWQASEDLKVFAEVERRIGQIEFIDFLASVNLTDDQQNLANPDLRPPQSWDFEIGATKQFSGITRSTVRIFARDISDLVDRIPVGDLGDAIGNIESAWLYGVEWDSTLDLSGILTRGMRLDARIQLQESELEDPVTGRERRISNNLRHLVDIGFRHDVSGSNWVWGGNLEYVRRAADFRFDEFSVFRQGAVGSVFVEHKDVFAGIGIKATVEQSLGDFQQVDRTRFVARRGREIDFIERRERNKGLIFRFSVSGTF
ncbi:TonB-dependent receptor [Altererythrobacter arenosus]|uniref:TonB-dependent receptor n=1 Tax=Altererythrobacter arenosus TaxID=3032592 RepID=A0ABY8FTE3_9SPHN|nr:TonB-dependent receptor [Altererythrobacter sp. CAU 1644]WFL78278.1 TonB-dependent receptor [Altererythrobacter sp. CAU 1644]